MKPTGGTGRENSGAVHSTRSGHQGKPIPSSVVVVCNADAEFWFITSTDSEGEFEASDLPANRFAIEVLSP